MYREDKKRADKYNRIKGLEKNIKTLVNHTYALDTLVITNRIFSIFTALMTQYFYKTVTLITVAIVYSEQEWPLDRPKLISFSHVCCHGERCTGRRWAAFIWIHGDGYASWVVVDNWRLITAQLNLAKGIGPLRQLSMHVRKLPFLFWIGYRTGVFHPSSVTPRESAKHLTEIKLTNGQKTKWNIQVK